jgi:hypothetical protein
MTETDRFDNKVFLSPSPNRKLSATNSPGSNFNASNYSKRGLVKLPVTNGLSNNQLFQKAYIKPKMMAERGGELSNNIHMIPGLR